MMAIQHSSRLELKDVEPVDTFVCYSDMSPELPFVTLREHRENRLGLQRDLAVEEKNRVLVQISSATVPNSTRVRVSSPRALRS